MAKKTIEQILTLMPSLFEIDLNSDKNGKYIFKKISQFCQPLL